MSDMNNTELFDEETLKAISFEDSTEEIEENETDDCKPVYGPVAKQPITSDLMETIMNDVANDGYAPSMNVPRKKLEAKATDIFLKAFNKYITIDYELLTSTDDEISDLRDFISEGILETYKGLVIDRNKFYEKTRYHYPIPQELSPETLATIILNSPDVRLVKLSYNKKDKTKYKVDAKSTPNKILGIRIRNEEDANNGIFVFNETKEDSLLNTIIFNLAYTSDSRTVNSVTRAVYSNAELISQNTSINLVPVNNGVFNLETQELTTWFSNDYEEKYSDIAFTFKSPVNYNKDAQDVALPLPNGDTYSVKMQFESVFKDNAYCETLAKGLYELVLHCLCGYSEGFASFLCNPSGFGGGGKSTIQQIIRNILGFASVCDAKIDDFDKKHGLDGIVGKSAIIADESKTSTKPLENTDLFKAIATGNPIMIEKKFKDPVSVVFGGPIVQSQQFVPRFSNADEAIFRRNLIFPFEQRFVKGGKKMKVIEEDYIFRDDVLEYLLKTVLELGKCEYSDDVKKVCNGIEGEKVKEESQPVYKFMNILTELYPGNAFAGLSFVPAGLLFNMFHDWYENANGTKSCMQATTFNRQLAEWVNKHEASGWTYKTGNSRIPRDYDGKGYVFNDFSAGPNWFDSNGHWCPKKATCSGGLLFVGDEYAEGRELIHACSNITLTHSDDVNKESDARNIKAKVAELTASNNIS